ncbi:MAG: CRISPR-associated endonuclease Cas2 [Clostridia bacterium]|nr:CRISPR-associated endonuclease Cas2 [Clostridia bacterium]
MRIMVFFDLPVKTAKERKIYTDFRRALIKDGYYMIQYSVYGRICNGVDSVEKFVKRLENYTPKEGSVRVLTVTEKQYASIIIVAGKKKNEEKDIRNIQLSFF